MAIVDLPGRGKCLSWDHKGFLPLYNSQKWRGRLTRQSNNKCCCLHLSCESELVKLSGVRTISRNIPSISSTTRGIWESSVSSRGWHTRWWPSSSSSWNSNPQIRQRHRQIVLPIVNSPVPCAIMVHNVSPYSPSLRSPLGEGVGGGGRGEGRLQPPVDWSAACAKVYFDTYVCLVTLGASTKVACLVRV